MGRLIGYVVLESNHHRINTRTQHYHIFERVKWAFPLEIWVEFSRVERSNKWRDTYTLLLDNLTDAADGNVYRSSLFLQPYEYTCAYLQQGPRSSSVSQFSHLVNQRRTWQQRAFKGWTRKSSCFMNFPLSHFHGGRVEPITLLKWGKWW